MISAGLITRIIIIIMIVVGVVMKRGVLTGDTSDNPLETFVETEKTAQEQLAEEAKSKGSGIDMDIVKDLLGGD